ncbi:PREDICTED: erythroferrone [Miniopterus natalensis]|uniref:erythroferrone n=1 Tax=Miniopterus natalensis TaxID=291302 RepID=UPI0007A6FEEA|nr:PREDICTED: erythroferrone [Miniopterus natalensis]
MSPWDTWMAFLRHNDKEDAAKKNRGKGRRPRPGLPGLSERSDALSFPSPIISSAELMKEFRLMIKDLAPRGHTQEDLEAAAANKDTVALLAEALALGPRSVEAAFHCRLHPNVPVERRTLHELGGYYLPNSEGTFHRGLGLNLTSGQYTAPIAGFYELAATLHKARPRQLSPWHFAGLRVSRERLVTLVGSLEAVAGLQSCSELFTISVNGVLYLQMGQYTSVFLENASGSLVTVRSGSQFSAILLGI